MMQIHAHTHAESEKEKYILLFFQKKPFTHNLQITFLPLLKTTKIKMNDIKEKYHPSPKLLQVSVSFLSLFDLTLISFLYSSHTSLKFTLHTSPDNNTLILFVSK